MKRFKSLNFRHTSMRNFFISTIIPILLVFIVLSIYYNNQASQSAENIFKGTLKSASTSLEIYFEDLNQISFTPYLYEDILETMFYMKNGYLDSDANHPDFIDIHKLQSNYTILFTKLLHSSQLKVKQITFYPLNGKSNNSFTIERSSAGLIQKPIDKEVLATLSKYVVGKDDTSPVYVILENNADKDCFTLLRVIRDYDTMKDIGILKIDVSLKTIISYLKGIETTQHSSIVLFDTSGTPVYSSQSFRRALYDKFNDKTKKITDGYHRYHLQEQEIGTSNWTLKHIYSYNDLLISNIGSFLLIFGIMLFTFAMEYILYQMQSRRLLSSLDSILQKIKQMQKGDLTGECVVNDRRELLIIADALNEMSKKLNTLIETEYKATVSKRNAEYLALQSQINPHFLYNILNGFIALNRIGEKELLEKSIIQLTLLFRYICSNNDTTTVSLEFDFASRYLELQKLRFEERIEYEIHLSEETKDIEIPKLVIQPIVENCVVHGMEEDDEPIIISLTSSLCKVLDQNYLMIDITDNGIGFDTAQVNSAPHVGLENVMQRLSYFHNNSHYEIQSNKGQGTKVKLFICLD